VATLLDVNGFKSRTVMPSADVDYLETAHPGFLANRILTHSSRIRARCRKRYADFVAPVPELVLGWLVALVTLDAYVRRGVNPSDESFELVKAAAELALADLKEAADGENGLFDLPARENTTEDGITRGGPLVYSEASPWDWTDVQAEALRGR